MSRELTSGMKTGVGAGNVIPIVMVRLDLDIGLIAVHSGVGSFPWNGDTYLGVGNYGGLSEIRESNTIAPYGVTATLSGIPDEFLSQALGDHYQGRPAQVYKALLTEAHKLIADPTLSFEGRCDYSKVKLGKTATVQMVIQSRLADWNRPCGRRFTHESQQQLYPGDMGLEFVGKQVGTPITWGG